MDTQHWGISCTIGWILITHHKVNKECGERERSGSD
jgi:hypothetical protein